MRRRGIGRVGRPSLVGTAARTAVVVGTASAVSGKMNQPQQAAEAPAAPAPEAAPAPAPAPVAPAGDPMVEQLTELAKLKDLGILTEEEFSAKKAQILGL